MDITEKIINLGKYSKKDVSSRNIWDMKLHNNRIYFANGDSTNFISFSRSGPDNILYLDNENNFISTNFKLYDEQINKFKIIDNTLYIPGSDSIESWDYGNYYKLIDDTWVKYKTIPKGIHVNDIEKFENYLFAAISSNQINTVIYSSDNGQTWDNLDKDIMSKYSLYGEGSYNLIKLNGNLYSHQYMNIPSIYKNMLKISIVDDNISCKIIKSNLLHNISINGIYNISRKEIFKDKLFYIVLYLSHGYLKPYGLFSTYKLEDKPEIIDININPTDIITYNDKIYISGYKNENGTTYKNSIYSSSDGINFIEEFYFYYNSFVRSFEVRNNNFYFGIGTYAKIESKPGKNSCGDVLMFKKDIFFSNKGKKIDLEVKINSNYKISLDFSSDNVNIYGNYLNCYDSPSRRIVFRQENKNGLYVAYGWYNSQIYQLKKDIRVILTQDRRWSYIGNKLIRTATKQEFNIDSNLRIGNIPMKIYGIRIWNEFGELIHNFTPKDNNILIDLITSKNIRAI